MTEQGSKGSALWLPIAIVIAGALVAGAVVFKDDKPSQDEDLKGKAKVEEQEEGAEVVEVSIDDDAIRGDENAKVTIVEFSDYECPFCAKAEPTMKKILKNYEGKVRWVYRDFPMSYHKDAQLASEASEAAHAQGKYWEYHDLLYKYNDSLKKADLIKYAEKLGLNMEQFKSDLESGKFKDEVVKDFEDGEVAGVDGTPCFFINGTKVVGAQPYEKFAEVIDAELEK